MQMRHRRLLIAAAVATIAMALLYRGRQPGCPPGPDGLSSCRTEGPGLQMSSAEPFPNVGRDTQLRRLSADSDRATTPPDTVSPSRAEPLRYVMLELAGRPTGEQINRLRREGVRIVAFAPPSRLVAGVPSGFDAALFPWLLGVYEPRADEKMGPRTTALVNAATADESVLVFAEFYDGVTGDEARCAAAEDGLEVLERGGLPETSLLVRGSATSVRRLAARNTVATILNAPQRFAENQSDILRMVDATIDLDGVVVVPLYVIVSTGWDGTGLGSASLKYYVGRTTYDLDSALAKAQVVRALNTWASVVDITWTETSLAHQTTSVDIVWLSPEDPEYSFSSTTTLAHSWYPCPPNPETIAGDIEVNDAKTWEIGDSAGDDGKYDIYSVVLHELGHSLGLGHSENTGSVMYAYFSQNTVFSSLTADDIAGIQAIYAAAPAPTVTCWESIQSHGAAGEVALEMTGDYVEARSAGLSTIRATFSRPLSPASVGSAPLVITGESCGAVSTTGCAVSLDTSACVLTVTLAAPLPDGDRYTISAATTLCGAGGAAVPSGQQVVVGALAGDVNNSGTVTASDVLAVRAAIGLALSTTTAGRDVNNSGAVTGEDMAFVVRASGRSLP